MSNPESNPVATEEKAASAEPFFVNWDGRTYRVSIPAWGGGEVVHGAAYTLLLARVAELEKELDETKATAAVAEIERDQKQSVIELANGNEGKN